VRTSASDILNSSYRASCYSSVGLDNRLSISATRGTRTVRLSFYRCFGNDFSEDEAGRVLDASDLLISVVWRHSEEKVAKEKQDIDAHFRDRLLTVAPSLPNRERDVCALIAQGVTSEGIGLKLGIGLGTVHTYRKRAYSRLNISSQNELMRLILT
jgi:DNA-binding CsgD family transcriptional regulator